MSRKRGLWSFAISAAFAAAVFAWQITINRNLAADVAGRVSEPSATISLCDLTYAFRMPTRCVPLDGQKLDRAISAIRQASAAEVPSHPVTKGEYLLKIVNSTDSKNPRTECFVLNEYEGFGQYLYLLPIRTGENCTGDTIKYAPGSARVRNFLHPPENQ